MFKKALLAAISIIVSSSAFAAPSYNGSMSSAPLGSGYQNEAALSDVVFNCDDQIYGHFDMCVDVTLVMARPGAKVRMGVNLSSKITQTHRNILVRYNFVRSPATVGLTTVWTTQVQNDRGSDYLIVPLNIEQKSVVTRVTKDGGATWSKLNWDIR